MRFPFLFFLLFPDRVDDLFLWTEYPAEGEEYIINLPERSMLDESSGYYYRVLVKALYVLVTTNSLKIIDYELFGVYKEIIISE